MSKISIIGICGNSVFMKVDHFHEQGETITAHGVHEEIGGKGINQAFACARMGAEVSFLAAIGNDDDGQKCRKSAQENNVNGFFAVKDNRRTALAVILTDSTGENQVTCYTDAKLCAEDVLLFEDEIADSDVLLLQNEVPQEVNEIAVTLAQKHHVMVILNPAPARQISDKIANAVYLVTPNEQEKQSMDIKRFKNYITTLGSKGCDVNGKTIMNALPVKAVDTTGAGDTFNGVLAVCLAEGMDMQTACQYAVCASGLSVTKQYVLNAIPTRQEVERMLENE